MPMESELPPGTSGLASAASTPRPRFTEGRGEATGTKLVSVWTPKASGPPQLLVKRVPVTTSTANEREKAGGDSCSSPANPHPSITAFRPSRGLRAASPPGKSSPSRVGSPPRKLSPACVGDDRSPEHYRHLTSERLLDHSSNGGAAMGIMTRLSSFGVAEDDEGQRTAYRQKYGTGFRENGSPGRSLSERLTDNHGKGSKASPPRRPQMLLPTRETDQAEVISTFTVLYLP